MTNHHTNCIKEEENRREMGIDKDAKEGNVREKAGNRGDSDEREREMEREVRRSRRKTRGRGDKKEGEEERD